MRLIYGVGINDANYCVKPIIKGRRVDCHFYTTWRDMIKRCHSSILIEKHPTYKGCKVCNEWLLFSNFRSWMETQDWREKQLDKDILFQGNKEYSPKKCVFVTPEINVLFSTNKNKGVRFSSSMGKYTAQCSYKRKIHHLGVFTNKHLALKVYKEFKLMVIAMTAEYQIEPLRSAMINYKINEK